MGYKPLEGYGIIGNLETCPLVGRDGSIDWCCFPQLESSSVFAALLDDETGGRFAIQPTPEFTAT
jgi:GH15 family glucan-1,4-alpha-glucosidase